MSEKIQRFIQFVFVQLILEATTLIDLAIAAGLNPSEDFVNADLSGMNLSGVNLSGYNLSGANLSGANLKRAFLRRANLSGANLSEARLDHADISGATLRSANLYRAKLPGVNLRVANLEEAELTAVVLDGADLRGASLNGANLHSARLGRVDFRGTHLIGANLSATNLRCADLRHAYLEGSNLSQCKLDGADLGNANLTGVDLSCASMQRVHGDGCNFSGACLNATDLSSSNFNAADFSNTHFEGTIVTRASLIGSQGISNGQQEDLELGGAFFSESAATEFGLTQCALEGRVNELEASVSRLAEWAENLNRRAVDEIAKRMVKSPVSSQVAQTRVLIDLANQIQESCKKDREFIQAYQQDLQQFPRNSEELVQEYANINEQIVKIGNFIRVVQIILVDVPGFIARSV
jgi:uncharacterized protein YjbI with pentapeptide repeats